jgi:Fur family peroxide stress response transcriptional regulator
MNNYTEILRAHNLKATPQRLEITSALDLYGHMNVDGLYIMMLKKFHSISLATIYKNINLMLEEAFIQEVKIPNSKSVYELTKAVHSHVVCSKCGYIEDLKIDLSSIEKDASHLSHFQIDNASLVFSGLCQNCQN